MLYLKVTKVILQRTKSIFYQINLVLLTHKKNSTRDVQSAARRSMKSASSSRASQYANCPNRPHCYPGRRIRGAAI